MCIAMELHFQILPNIYVEPYREDLKNGQLQPSSAPVGVDGRGHVLEEDTPDLIALGNCEL